jgi:hypothetical protein
MKKIEFVTVYNGKPRMKYVDGNQKLVMPFVGSIDGGNFGVGLIVDNEPYTLWGLAGVSRGRLKEYYRAMRMLDEMEFITVFPVDSHRRSDIYASVEAATKSPNPEILSQIGLERYKQIINEEPDDLEEAFKKIPEKFVVEGEITGRSF